MDLVTIFLYFHSFITADMPSIHLNSTVLYRRAPVPGQEFFGGDKLKLVAKILGY
jgi:hypothetical protein